LAESVRHDSKLKAIRAAIGAAPRVRHIPLVPHSELPSLYSLADVFVIPLLYEGFGLTPLEAMACGTPVAAARTSSLPEVLGEDAVWFEPLDAPGMAEAITGLLNAPELRRDLAERGLMRASGFSWDSAASQVLAAYQEVLGQNG
jgi:glycosyltransferase involved in cell wall biosynthesis